MPLIVSGTDSITLPVGTTAQRNATPVTGMYRLNSTTGTTEVYNGTNWVTESPVSGTAVASTSGTSIDFTSIPAGVKRITVMLSGVSTNGTSVLLVQLGDSGGIETTGYTGSASNLSTGVTSATYTTGFGCDGGARSAGDTTSGLITICSFGSNQWIASGTLGRTDSGATRTLGGNKTLSDTLTQIRITTVNGTDTFDAGSINILYE